VFRPAGRQHFRPKLILGVGSLVELLQKPTQFRSGTVSVEFGRSEGRPAAQPRIPSPVTSEIAKLIYQGGDACLAGQLNG
jgi:hypothetical protein